MKYTILKVLDVAGITFLSPVVRLCYGEEPQVQIKKIGQVIVIPLLAILAFIMLWFVLADKVKTKSGKLPDPAQTLTAGGSIWKFHTREGMKEEAFAMTGDQRQAALTEAERELEALPAEEEKAKSAVVAAEATAAEAKAKRLEPIQAKYEAKKAEFDAADAAREAELKARALTISAGDEAAHATYLKDFRAHEALSDQEKDQLKEINDQRKEIQQEKSLAVTKAQYALTLIAEEQQYLNKLTDMLTSANRQTKVESATEKLADQRAAFAASTGEDVYKTAKKLANGEGRIERISESEYAKPASLVYQTKRSLLCVFFGFLLATIIAVPIGILCGLNSTIMAALTPFIALFKPVSPIVWLPIALIIVSAQIPDPDTHWFMTFMEELPWLGQYKINPAFIASGITVALCSLWPTLVNTALGVASVDKDHNNVAKVLKLGFWSRLFKIVIPSALPLIFAGLRISLGVGWMVLIAAELLASSEGIGKFVWDQFNNGASDSFAKMVVVVFVVGFFGLLLDRIMIVLQKLVTFDESPASV